MAVPWVRFTENALVPKIMLQFQNGDTSWHQGDSAGIFMYSAGIFETFVKKILCQRASPMCTVTGLLLLLLVPVLVHSLSLTLTQLDTKLFSRVLLLPAGLWDVSGLCFYTFLQKYSIHYT